MLWTYGSIIVICALIGGGLFHYFIKNKLLAAILTLLVIVVSALVTHFLVIPHLYHDSIIAAELRKQSPFMDFIAQNAPEEFNDYVSKLKTASPNNLDTIYYNEELLNNLLTVYGPLASNDSLYQYLQAAVAFEKQLFAIDPLLVLFHEFPDKFMTQINSLKLNEKEIEIYKNNPIFKAAEGIVKSGIENPQPLPTTDQLRKAETVFREVVANLSKKYGSEVVIQTFQHPDAPSLDKKTAAQVIISFYEELLSQGKENASIVMKTSLLINKAKQQQTLPPS